MLVKSENCENDDSDYNLSNNRHEPGQNHINLTVSVHRFSSKDLCWHMLRRVFKLF